MDLGNTNKTHKFCKELHRDAMFFVPVKGCMHGSVCMDCKTEIRTVVPHCHDTCCARNNHINHCVVPTILCEQVSPFFHGFCIRRDIEKCGFLLTSLFFCLVPQFCQF